MPQCEKVVALITNACRTEHGHNGPNIRHYFRAHSSSVVVTKQDSLTQLPPSTRQCLRPFVLITVPSAWLESRLSPSCQDV
ncbi:hypothetical protein GJAV_G00225010 [Gymnothorax javanicus]|nr:hypothetical protein GJAV_G00225010 [Gymnothorax javanicus]